MTFNACDKESYVANVIVSPASATIEMGGSWQLEAILKDASGNILTDRSVSWSSSNVTVATVSSSGLATGIIEGGPITITATSEGQRGKAQIIVTPIPVASLTLSPLIITIEIGETKLFTTTLKDAKDNILMNRTISWSSGNIVVTTVSSSGLVTGLSAGGPVAITATSEGKSCTAQIIVITASVSSVVVTPPSANVIVGKNLQFSAIILDSRGGNLTDRQIVWSMSSSGIATISNSGLMTGLVSGGPVTITAMCEGKTGTSQLMVTPTLPAGVSVMFNNLASLITYFIEYNQSSLISNPHLATQIESKIEMLKSPTLANEIVDGSFYSADIVTSADGRQIPISVVFPLESMRFDAYQSVISVKHVLPILESFMDVSFPWYDISIWYGFRMGMAGGGGHAYMEDQKTYEARTGPNRFPYEAGLFHEISHSYIGNESLNQFLEIYQFNMVHANSYDVKSWIYMRNYTAWQVDNTGCFALMDIYQLIGHGNMSKAFKILYSLNPPYGSPLSAECKQAIIDQAPIAVKAQVITKVGMITL
jgi:uncharacterized protein YjdB